MNKNVNAYSKEDVKFLKENWTDSDHIDIFIEKFGRNRKSILLKAKTMGLPVKLRRFLREVTPEMINDCNKFIEVYRELRSFTKVTAETGIYKRTLDFVMEKNLEIHNSFKQAREFVKSTFICRYCKEILNNKECYMDIENHPMSHKICKPCNAKKSQQYRDDKDNCFNILLQGMKSRCPEVTIDASYLEKLYIDQKGKCHYTGLDMLLNSDIDRDFHKISVDKIDPCKNYIKGNIVLCCWGINKMKSDTTYINFINICKLISDKHYMPETFLPFNIG